jgi:uncharacterized membrane protein
MIALSALVHVPARAVAVIAVGAIALQNLTDRIPPIGGALGVVWMVLHRPGALIARPDMIVIVGYPLLGWAAIMALGFSIGPVFTWAAERRRAFLLRAGLAAVAGFIVLRALNLYGDPRPWSGQHSAIFTILSFINTTKTPPSLLYDLMTIGPALLLLRLFDSDSPALLGPALTIGRVPMFYFIAHVLVIHLMAMTEGLVRYGSLAITARSPSPDHFPFAQPPGWPASLPVVYGAWLVAVLLLYPCCRWYARYKAAHTSWWLSYL